MSAASQAPSLVFGAVLGVPLGAPETTPGFGGANVGMAVGSTVLLDGCNDDVLGVPLGARVASPAALGTSHKPRMRPQIASRMPSTRPSPQYASNHVAYGRHCSIPASHTA